MYFILTLLLLQLQTFSITCKDQYTCFQENDDLVWVIHNEGNINGPNCKAVCEDALCPSGTFHICNEDFQFPASKEEFATVAAAFNFECKNGGCWGSKSWDGQLWVSINTNANGKRDCYFPNVNQTSCTSHPGNANCFGSRFANVCPCIPKALDEACVWENPPHCPRTAVWPEDPDGTTCLERINYWRKRACEEGWPECPPCGLPPMTECINCHPCANMQSQYDSKNGAHKSFTWCGDSNQGSGGGATCADVIDAFVSEREDAVDRNGVKYCTGHCGPIVASGCTKFFWGKAHDSNWHTLNWGNCPTDDCEGYCEDNEDGENPCFLVDNSPPDTCPLPSAASARSSGNSSSSDGMSAGAIVGIVIATLVAIGGIAALVWYFHFHQKTVDASQKAME